jgi:hypothetical protein
MVGYRLGRRDLLKTAAGAAALGLALPAGLARAQVELGTASGELTLGSNYTDTEPNRAGLNAALEARTSPSRSTKSTITPTRRTSPPTCRTRTT